MSRKYVIGTEAEIDELESDLTAVVGYPSRNAPIGPGPHLVPSKTPGGKGWTTKIAIKKKHPKKNLWALEVPPRAAEQLDQDEKAKKVLKARREQVKAKVQAARALGKEWDEEEEKPDTPGKPRGRKK